MCKSKRRDEGNSEAPSKKQTVGSIWKNIRQRFQAIPEDKISKGTILDYMERISIAAEALELYLEVHLNNIIDLKGFASAIEAHFNDMIDEVDRKIAEEKNDAST